MPYLPALAPQRLPPGLRTQFADFPGLRRANRQVRVARVALMPMLPARHPAVTRTGNSGTKPLKYRARIPEEIRETRENGLTVAVTSAR
jgi:hypothetical protein